MVAVGGSARRSGACVGALLCIDFMGPSYVGL